MLRAMLCALSFLAATSCGRESADQAGEPAPDPFQAEWAAYERLRASDSRPVSLFPDAAEVRLFVNEDVISFDANGEPSNGTHPRRGIRLTQVEAEALRNAVRDVPPPPATVDCCIPRHAFVFYDGSGARLGALDVCFECGCAHIADGARLDRHREVRWLHWDEQAIGAIVTAHGQRTTFEEPAQ